jgi:hypothetical protein
MLFLVFYIFFSASFCITFLSDGIAMPINKQISYALFLIIMSGLMARTYLFVSFDSMVLLHLHDHIIIIIIIIVVVVVIIIIIIIIIIIKI